jgi:hypothetical protein
MTRNRGASAFAFAAILRGASIVAGLASTETLARILAFADVLFLYSKSLLLSGILRGGHGSGGQSRNAGGQSGVKTASSHIK